MKPVDNAATTNPGREIVWSAVQWPACEHLDLRADTEGVVADGVVVGVIDGVATRLRYHVACDVGWNVRGVSIDLHGHPPVSLTRQGDRWHDAAGIERADLAGCTDVDIAVTPFTNTIPIRRLRLGSGDSADIRVIYIEPTPELQITAESQRYTRLPTGYRYRSGTFTADLEVDGDGIVVDYPQLWTLRRSSGAA